MTESSNNSKSKQKKYPETGFTIYGFASGFDIVVMRNDVATKPNKGVLMLSSQDFERLFDKQFEANEPTPPITEG